MLIWAILGSVPNARDEGEEGLKGAAGCNGKEMEVGRWSIPPLDVND